MIFNARDYTQQVINNTVPNDLQLTDRISLVFYLNNLIVQFASNTTPSDPAWNMSKKEKNHFIELLNLLNSQTVNN